MLRARSESLGKKLGSMTFTLPKSWRETQLLTGVKVEQDEAVLAERRNLTETKTPNELSQITSIDRSIDKKIVKYMSDLKLDILVYSDIGMTIESVIFAHMRLAPVQINTWGHSVTSGISTVDYYFSSDLYEIEKAQENYSEKLPEYFHYCSNTNGGKIEWINSLQFHSRH